MPQHILTLPVRDAGNANTTVAKPENGATRFGDTLSEDALRDVVLIILIDAT
jgi:hypothetical protein